MFTMSVHKSQEVASSSRSSHKHTTAGDSDRDENYYDAECGIGSFKPTALRMCANMTVFTGVYSMSALLTTTLSFFVNSQVQ